MAKVFKISLAITLTICAYLVCVTSLTLAGVSEEHIVGMWLFDDGEGDIAADTSGNGHDGLLMGAVSWVEDGQFGSALEFFAGEDMVMVEHSDDLNLLTFTIMCWVKAPSAGTGEAIIHKQSTASVRNYIMNITAADVLLGSLKSVDAAAKTNCTGTTSIHDDQWHHVAATYDQETVSVYVDGVVDGEMSVPSEELEITEEPLLFGHAGGTGGWRYTGLMDEVAVFNVALSKGEILACMLGLEDMLVVAPAGKLTTAWGAMKKE